MSDHSLDEGLIPAVLTLIGGTVLAYVLARFVASLICR